MKLLARGVALSVILSSALARRARAQPEPDVIPVPAPPPAPVAPKADSRWSRADGPGDEEAKADFQEARPLADGSPLRFAGPSGFVALYGFGALDVLRDSTPSFGVAANNFQLARPATFAGDNGQSHLTVCDSRVGLRLGTSETRSVRAVFVAELGPAYRTGDGGDYPCSGNHVRHLYFGLRSPIVDVLVGKYYALFGWGGKGFLPNTAAFMGVPGQLYRLEPQLRAAHIFRFAPVDFEIAGALSGSSSDGDTGTSALEVAMRLAVNRWRGASSQGGGPPVAVPLQIGISSIGRGIAVNDLSGVPGARQVVTGGGLALDVFAPLLPAHGDDLSNALSVTLEMTAGAGLADLYPGLTGGVLFPALPNPANVLPAPVYTPGVAPGIATFDSSGDLHAINWRTLVFGVQYHLPVETGRRVWVSALGSLTQSNNALSLTPAQGWAFVWNRGAYVDLNVFVALTRAFQMALSAQATQQTFGDGVVARNARSQVAATYFF